MTPILDKIRSAGGTVVVLAGKLRIEVPPGLLTDQDKQDLAQHRDELIRLLIDTPEVVGTDQNHEVELVQDLDVWLRDNTVEPIPCGTCGGLERWEDLAGGWHCAKCDPPTRAQILRERAARLRRRYSTSPRNLAADIELPVQTPIMTAEPAPGANRSRPLTTTQT